MPLRLLKRCLKPYHDSVPLISTRVTTQNGEALEGVDGHILAIAKLVHELDLQVLDIVDAWKSAGGVAIEGVQRR